MRTETILIICCIVAATGIVVGLAGTYFYWAATAIVRKVKGEGTEFDQDPTPFMAGMSYLFWAGFALLVSPGDVNPENQGATAMALIASFILAVILVVAITKQFVKLIARGSHFAHWWKITPCHL